MCLSIYTSLYLPNNLKILAQVPARRCPWNEKNVIKKIEFLKKLNFEEKIRI